MTVRRLFFLALVVLVAVVLAPRMRGQQPQRFIYAALPGVGGGNNMNYGGAGILVFDIDHGHKFVKRVAMPTSLPLPASTNGRPVSPQESIKGITAHARTARLYVSTNRRVAAYNLLTDTLVWEQRYEERGYRSHRAVPRRHDALRAGARRAEMGRGRREDRRADHHDRQAR